MSASQPRLLVRWPVHDVGLSHEDVVVQTCRTTCSLWKTSLVLDHSPLDVTRYLPLSSMPVVSSAVDGGCDTRCGNQSYSTRTKE